MSNQFYAIGEGRAGKVRDLFATVAPHYDLINDLQSFGLHRWWKRKLIQMANPKPLDRAIDLCCGTGDIAFALAARGASVIGLDFSEPMLGVARRRQLRRTAALRAAAVEVSKGASHLPAPASSSHPQPDFVEFIQGDAQALAFEDGSFDIVTIGYGLRNLADPKAGLLEMRRVLKPGGRLLVLDFGKPDNPLWRALYFAYLRFVVPVFGRVFCGDSQTHSYIFESLRHYPAQKGIAAIMRELGCSDVRVQNLMGGIMSINYGRKT